MAWPVWSGTLSLGLVTVPVALYSATQDHSIAFRQIQRGTTDGNHDMIKVESEELDEIAPGRSHSLEIDTFVELAEIDPVFFDRTYWLAPTRDDFARAYDLVLRPWPTPACRPRRRCGPRNWTWPGRSSRR